ncbi:MAG: neutral zinc metallopeptidase, partial [Myxococcales bacterium]|nr:neutral zinc metallopeptidase [Myxococcales bacterium]
MKLDNVRQSSNVDDRRGQAVKRGGAAVGGVGILIALVYALVTGKSPLALLEGAGQSSETATSVDPNDPGAVFTRKILATTEDVWNQALPTLGKKYEEPTLVLFRGGVSSACGFQESAVGPFYCPGDQKAFVDLEFLDDLQKKLGAQ